MTSTSSPPPMSANDLTTELWRKGLLTSEQWYEAQPIIRKALASVRAGGDADAYEKGIRDGEHVPYRALEEIRKAVNGWKWVLTSRGPYEWDDDRYIDEAGYCMRYVLKIADKAYADMIPVPSWKRPTPESRDAGKGDT